MKKVISVILCVMMITMVSCGSSEEETLGTEWTTGQFQLNGTVISMPFDYHELSSLNCKLATQEYNNLSEDYVMNAMSSEEKVGIKDETSGELLYMGCGNTGDNTCTIKNTKIYCIHASKGEKKNASLILPGDITWGASAENIKKVYGEPNGKAEEAGMTVLNYTADNPSDTLLGKFEMTLTVDDKDGLEELYLASPISEKMTGDETDEIEKRIATKKVVSSELDKLPKSFKQPAVKLGDKIFGLPITVSDMKTLGFKMADGTKNPILNPENTFSCQLVSELFGTVDVEIVNLDSKLRYPEDAWIDEITLDKENMEHVEQVLVSGELKFGEMYDAVKALFQNQKPDISDLIDQATKVIGSNYKFSLEDIATGDSAVEFGIGLLDGIQKIKIAKHRYVFQ